MAERLEDVEGGPPRVSLGQIGWCLAGVALLPPVSWAMLSQHFRVWLADSLSQPTSLWLSTLVIGTISATLALVSGFLLFYRPLNLLRRTERRLRSLSMRDGLTGLLNRDGVRIAMDHAIAQSAERGRRLGVVLIDVDKFRLINSSLGETSGDLLLATAAKRVQSMVRTTDLCGRVGADQFVVLATGQMSLQSLYVMARNLQRAFEVPFKTEASTAVMTPSFGIAMITHDSMSADELMASAETALRRAKEMGGARICHFDPQMQVDAGHELEVGVRLHEALHHSEFKLLYQPVFAADGESIVTAEALLRWTDPVRGVVSPAEFIPVLEQSGLITQVGRWVMMTACTQGRAWIDAGASRLVISVNVSPRQFAEQNFVQAVERVLSDTGFPANQLQLEITEGILLDPTRDVMQKLDSLAARGIRFALDDFGMGYSSLAYLKLFPLHTLKIDRNFVKDLPGAQHDSAIARAVISLGQGLGMHVTAEGVETRSQYELLASMSCDSFQGFYFAKPIEPEAVSEALASQSGKPPPANKLVESADFSPYQVMPVTSRVRIIRNGELLGETTNALRWIKHGIDSEQLLYLPRQDIKVKLGESGESLPRAFLGEQRFLDLLGRKDQIVSPQIAWVHPGHELSAKELSDYVAFAPDKVVIEESPLH